jgi:hypothetical protein
MEKEELKALVDKIQSMTAKEIILTMVESLRNPVTKIDMSTFGFKDVFGENGKKNICYGCAATNTICKIGGFDPSIVLDVDEYRQYRHVEIYDPTEICDFKCIIMQFEWAIDALRMGNIDLYNEYAEGRFSSIPRCDYYLPVIEDSFTDEDLKFYEYFANTL